VQSTICCTACAPEEVRTQAKAKQSESNRNLAALPFSSTPRAPMPAAAPEPSSAPLVIGVAVVGTLVLLAILAASVSSSPQPRPAPEVAAPPVTPAPAPPQREEVARPAPTPPRPVEIRPKPPEPETGELKPSPRLAEAPKVEPTPRLPDPAAPPAPKPPEPVAKPPEPAPAPKPEPPRRPPPPETAKLREAEAALRKSFTIDQAKSPKEKSDLARTLLSEAATSGAKDAELFVRLRTARDLAQAAAETKVVLEAIDAIAAAFDVEALSEKTIFLTRVQTRPADALAWSRACMEVARQASAADDYDAAGRLAARAETLSGTAKEFSYREEIRERVKEYAELKREGDRVKPALDTLKTAPGDPGACGTLGRYLCLIKEDWEKGLPLMAKGPDAPLKKISEQELAKPADPAAQAALGEVWAIQSDKEAPIAKIRAKLRAIEWLERSVAGLSGSAKTSAEKRLAALNGALGPKAPPVLDLGGIKLELIYCKPGAFVMGQAEAPTESWEQDPRPPHRVELTRGFFLGKFEVTRGQFAAFVKATGYVTDAEREGFTHGRRADNTWADLPGANWRKLPLFTQTDDEPVLAMSWNDAKAFCDWASARTRRSVRLPTEAEWEYACRAGTTTPYSFGSDPSRLIEFGWGREGRSDWIPRPVGQLKPNPWGFFDMHGNTWELCQDFLGAYPKGDVRDPEGPPTSPTRALRGGSFECLNANCTASTRIHSGPTGRMVGTGFRVAVR
jgi:formylglycine-generating enzyme required for sulfatase activity